ncbi:RDD family protein [Halorientalis pallida]|uniref:RDD family protein n=1 Tax=Halorientalis pallida TaxID=2479928 RepID=A0A498L7G4_9EURY|nr:RDD family protein [Halorientalis pallida]RXK51103.1 RDD family protein [Halorientalis pallida]
MEALDSERCGVGIRGVAMAIDSVVWIALFMIAVSAVGAVSGQTVTTASGVETDLTGTPAAIALGLCLALAIGYHTLAEWRYGKTLGKYLVSIRVVADDGTVPSLGAVLGRNVLRLVDWLPLFYLVGIGAVVVSDGQRRLGDRMAGTAVVRS